MICDANCCDAVFFSFSMLAFSPKLDAYIDLSFPLLIPKPWFFPVLTLPHLYHLIYYPPPPHNSFPLIPLHFFKECARRRQRVQSIDPLLRAPSHRPEKKFNSFALSVGTISVPCPLIPLHSPSLPSIGRLSCSSQCSWLFCPLALPIYH